jgi:hypothetical protein
MTALHSTVEEPSAIALALYPQTFGGLLIDVPDDPGKADPPVLRAAGVECWSVGGLESGAVPRLE